MLTKQDELLLKSKGIKFADFEKQLADFKTGFPFLRLESAATIGNGIVRLNEDAIKNCYRAGNNYKAEKHKVVKFVPASGAASRMFKIFLLSLMHHTRCLQPISRSSFSII